jgi:hypothetical protein
MGDAWNERKKGVEEEYFHRKEQEALEKTRQRIAVEQKAQPHAEFSMRCPKCGSELKELSFHSVQIDQCPGCHGVWLDAGELERVAAQETQSWLSYFWRATPGH